jgi:hypothetical protein
MSKVKGPMMSLSASKTLKKTLTFQGRPSGCAVYKYTKPGDVNPFTPSVSQETQRARIGALVAQWQALSEAGKAVWNEAAKNVNYVGTGYHYFIHKSALNFLLLETGDFLLQEDSGKIILE